MYKFLREGLKSENGRCKWKIGEWKKVKKIDMCSKGFHCSKEKYQAFSYVQGEILAEVEVRGESQKQSDKEVWSEMRIVRAWRWQKKDSVALTIYAAEQCLKNFEKEFPKDKRPREAINAAKKWLKEPTEENRSAAESAARSAGSAARSAWSAGSAAWSAKSAESAAESAAKSAESAAGSAAWSAARSAWSAGSAAWSAKSAESAAESAAKSAESAAESAAINKITKWIDKRELEVWEEK